VAAIALTFPGAEVDAPGRTALAARVRACAAQVARRIRGRASGAPGTSVG
jgi:DNA-binding IclR family transcriptional regulator